MTTDNLLAQLFPSCAADIPEQFRLGAPIEQRDYLVDGQLRVWNGPWPKCSARCNWVTSAYKSAARRCWMPTPPSAPSTPPCRAYDRGQGEWPTMRVVDRIRHVEAFLRACANSVMRWSSC